MEGEKSGEGKYYDSITSRDVKVEKRREKVERNEKYLTFLFLSSNISSLPPIG